jgi:hypothetical protein
MKQMLRKTVLPTRFSNIQLALPMFLKQKKKHPGLLNIRDATLTTFFPQNETGTTRFEKLVNVRSQDRSLMSPNQMYSCENPEHPMPSETTLNGCLNGLPRKTKRQALSSAKLKTLFIYMPD